MSWRRKYNEAAAPPRRIAISHPWDLDFPLINLSAIDALTVGNSFEGIGILGGNGSGKTTGSGRAILRAAMRAGFGVFATTAKPGDADMIWTHAREAGRAENVYVFSPEHPWRFNFLQYEQKRPGRGAGLTENIVKLFTTAIEAGERSEGHGGKSDTYFRRALQQELRNCIDLALLARPEENLSVRLLHEILMSAPMHPDQVHSELWQQNSLCYQLLERALERKPGLSRQQQRDLDITGPYWLNEFPNLPWETRGGIISTFTTMADVFLRGPIGELFSTGLNIVPEITQEGAILIIDLPLKTYGQLGLFAQTVWKLLFEQSIERRDVTKNPRPVLFWMDEAHLFINEHDVEFCTTARAARACPVFLSQTLPNFHYALGGEGRGKALTESLWGVLGTKIFHAQTDPTTLKWAADVFTKSWQSRANSGINRTEEGKGSANAGFSQSLEHNVQEQEFTRLRKGGPANDFLVDAIINQGGRIWNATGTNYLYTTFDQKGD